MSKHQRFATEEYKSLHHSYNKQTIINNTRVIIPFFSLNEEKNHYMTEEKNIKLNNHFINLFYEIFRYNPKNLILPTNVIGQLINYQNYYEYSDKTGPLSNSSIEILEDNLEKIEVLKEATKLQDTFDENSKQFLFMKNIVESVIDFYLEKYRPRKGEPNFEDYRGYKKRNIPYIISLITESQINLPTRNFYTAKIIGASIDFLMKNDEFNITKGNNISTNIDIFRFHTEKTYTHQYNLKRFIEGESVALKNHFRKRKEHIFNVYK